MLNRRIVGILVVAAVLLSLSASALVVARADTAEFDGAMPSGGIVVLGDAVYGTTEYGGPNCRERKSYQETSGCGVVYRMSADGQYSVLHAFAGDDGRKPTSGLVAGHDGFLYGATDAGGEHGHGVIFRVARDGADFAVLYAFTSGDRHGALTIGDDGTIYGVAPAPESTGHGATIFALSSGGAYRTLHSFGLESHVASPLAVDASGRLLGIVARAKDCGGEVFWVTGSGAFGRLYSNAKPYTSPACATAKIPSSPLLASAGVLFATDDSSVYAIGGAGVKVLFSVPPVSHPQNDLPSRFTGIIVDGSLTRAPDGALVGAVTGSRAKGCGTVFRFSPTSGYTALYTFALTDNACIAPSVNPAAAAVGMAYRNDGALYGTAPLGADCAKHDARPTAPHSCGSLYRIAGSAATVLHVFEPLDPPVPDRNRYPLGAWFGVLGARPPDELIFGVTIWPFGQAPYSVRTATSALSVHPTDDPSQTIPLRFDKNTWTIAQQAGYSNTAARGDVSATAQGLNPGMYTIDLTRFNPVVTDADAYGIPMDSVYPSSFYIPPPPDVLPGFRVGQQFVTFHQPNPDSHPTAEPAGIRLLTLRAIAREGGSLNRLTFEDADSGATRSIDALATDVNSLPGLTPIVADANVDDLNNKYQGRDLYVLGDFAPTCAFADGGDTTASIDRTTPLHVRRIVRLYGTSASWGIGPLASRMLDTGSKFVAADPLLVIFDSTTDGGVLAEPPFAGHGCVAGYAEFADAWDFGRTLARESPLLSHPEWPAADRKAIADGTVLVGMTYEMVIASVGYPSVYGTAAQMRKLDTWEYALPAPSSFSVKFKDGVVVDYTPPRMPP